MPSNVISCLRYRQAPAAIEFLKSVLGFQPHLVVPGPPDGSSETIAHAQLRHPEGGGMIMLGSVIDSEFGKLMAQPDEVGGRETQSVYIYLSDADAVYARVTAANWTIHRQIQDEDYGGRGFTCADPEGHIWSVGSYNPWEEAAG